MNNKNYSHFLIMTLLNLTAMYFLMYAMVNTLSNVFNNFNQFYMAGLMTASMATIEIVFMKSMYHNKKWNIVIIAASILSLIVFFLLIRQQTAISDKQFLRSMIPHHAGAILMCKQATIHNPEIKKLCETIIASQQAEIDSMKAILNKLE